METQKEYLTTSELLDYLPIKITKRTLYKWVKDNKIPFIKRSKYLLFKKTEIDKWLQE